MHFKIYLLFWRKRTRGKKKIYIYILRKRWYVQASLLLKVEQMKHIMTCTMNVNEKIFKYFRTRFFFFFCYYLHVEYAGRCELILILASGAGLRTSPEQQKIIFGQWFQQLMQFTFSKWVYMRHPGSPCILGHWPVSRVLAVLEG